jgi:hypothetical protein
MPSTTAYNYFLAETNNAIAQIASAQQAAADLTNHVARVLEQTVRNQCL